MGSKRDREPGDGELIGREQEVAILLEGVRDAVAGRGRVFLISGEAGIGKTRLADEVCARAGDITVAVAWGRCWKGEDAPPFWPWVQVLRSLATPHEGALAVLQRIEDPAEREGFDLLDAASGSLADLSRGQPLLLVLDDLHDASEASLRLLEVVARGIRASQIALVGTYREQEVAPGSSTARILEAIGRESRKIRLSGFDEPEVDRYFEQLTGHPPPPVIAGKIAQATEGNPFLVQEMARQFETTGDLHRPDRSMGFRVPRGADELIRSRIQRLDPDVVRLLETASVIGREFDAALLEKVNGEDRAQVMALLDQAVASGVIEEASALGRYAFSHVLDREALYQGLGTAERTRLHLEAGEALEELNQQNLDDHVGELAQHFFKAGRAGDMERALDYTVRAARRAVERGELEEAERQRHRALTVAEGLGLSPERRSSLAEALGPVGPPVPPPAAEAAPEDAFIREGEYWTVVFEGVTSRVKDSKGLRYISYLLGHPGEEFHVMYLASLVEPEGVSQAAARPDPEAPVPLGAEDSGEVLDAAARFAYRRRLADLREEVEEAEAWHDPERASRARSEMEFLTGELAAAVGIGGRPRRVGSRVERARLTVTKAIRRALDRLGRENPALGRHFDATIRTGTFVSYKPDPRTQVAWRV